MSSFAKKLSDISYTDSISHILLILDLMEKEIKDITKIFADKLEDLV